MPMPFPSPHDSCQFAHRVRRCAGLMLPAAIEDHTLPTPQSSYGIQKFIGERPRSKNLKKPPGWRALAFKRLSR